MLVYQSVCIFTVSRVSAVSAEQMGNLRLASPQQHENPLKEMEHSSLTGAISQSSLGSNTTRNPGWKLGLMVIGSMGYNFKIRNL